MALLEARGLLDVRTDEDEAALDLTDDPDTIKTLFPDEQDDSGKEPHGLR